MTSPSTSFQSYDVVVVGLGIMGAATVAELARRGARVAGVEARGPTHVRGSSYGDARIFRKAYWEGEHYVPLLDRAEAGWLRLNETSGRALAVATGGLFIGSARAGVVRGSEATAQRWGIPHAKLVGREVSRAFPAFEIGEDYEAIHEPEALMLRADDARLALLTNAVSHGAHLFHGQSVAEIVGDGASLRVSAGGLVLRCDRAVLASGPWIGRMLSRELGPFARPHRIPVYWFQLRDPSDIRYRVGQCPVFLYEEEGGSIIYGCPASGELDGGGLKVGFHNRQLSACDPEMPNPGVTRDEIDEMWSIASVFLPGIKRDGARGMPCIYTMSPDEDFIVGRSDAEPRLSYVSACSGHGFKFAPGLAEILADLSLAPIRFS